MKHIFCGIALSLLICLPIYGNISNASIPQVIDSPGAWRVLEAIQYTATSNTPAILVTSNDVTINLHEFSFSQVDGIYSVTAIQLAPNVSRISIKNGTFLNFMQSAISLAHGDSFVFIKELNFNGMGNRCIECIGAVGATAFQIEITDCNFLNSCTLTTADNVITISNCTDVILQDDILSTNGSFSATGTLVGVKLTNCARYLLDNIGIGNSKGSIDLRGISLNNSSGGIIENCRVTNGQAASATSFCNGYHFENIGATGINFVTNCLAFGLVGNTVDGFLSDTGSNGNMFRDCLSGGMTAVGATGIAHGYRSINNTKTTYRDCEARSNSASTSTVAPYGAYGFKLDTVTSGALISCISSFNAAPAGSAVGIYGIQSTSCLFRENQSSNNTQGYDFQGTFTQNTFVRNVAERNSNASQYNGFPTTAVSDNIWSSSVEVITAPWTNVGIS